MDFEYFNYILDEFVSWDYRKSQQTHTFGFAKDETVCYSSESERDIIENELVPLDVFIKYFEDKPIFGFTDLSNPFNLLLSFKDIFIRYKEVQKI